MDINISEIAKKIFYQDVLKTAGIIIGILVLAYVGIKIGDAIIDRIFRPGGKKLYFDEKRILTLRTLVKSILRYATYFIVGFTILVQIAGGITKIQGFLAGAGIIGLAVGFGAQSLVKDVITGFFILLEDQYSVGEYITTGNFSGFVEEMELRVTKLRDWGGEYHIIPNGQITAVTNFSRGHMRAMVDVAIAYGEDIDRAIAVMNQAVNNVKKDMAAVIVEGPEVLGVVNLGPTEVIIRTVAKAKAMEQWGVERALRKEFKEAFDREGIEIPYQHRIVINQPEGFNQKKSPSSGKELQTFGGE